MGMTGGEFALLSLTLGVGAVLQVSVGFGPGVIAAPVFSPVDPGPAPSVVLLLAVGVTAAVLVREGGGADLRAHRRGPFPAGAGERPAGGQQG
ncbi:hypothetical protein ACF07S_20695 [Streptomyces sp. NPDC016640]|uniref:hypothetical protein n=1 Tax=Streptomyces sp. NPDC016640 TaxID=3364969 RepID=UPI0036FE8C39